MFHKNLNNKREPLLDDKATPFLSNPLLAENLTDIHALENWLDDAIRVVKGIMSATKAKEFLLPLFFYKYLSDISDAPLVNTKLLNLPLEYRWEAIQNHPIDGSLGEFINKLMHEVTLLNPGLKGILDLVDYGKSQNEHCMVNDNVLRKLIEIISRYDLANATSYLDLWGNIYGYLLQSLPEKHKDEQGQFYTPREAVDLMIKLIQPDPKGNFYDPACGSGCLSGVFHHLNILRTEQKTNTKLVGQDKISIASAVTKMDLYFQDTVKIHEGDTLRDPLLDERGELPRFQYILTNPPWNLPGYDEVFYRKDRLKRFQRGVPPKKTADWGWVQHILASLDQTEGRAAIILDLGALSRGSGSISSNKERDIRKALIELDIIEVVISLSSNLFYGTAAPCAILLWSEPM